MALTVEDGTQVTGANSYVSRADVIAYAAARGVTLTDDATTDGYLIQAAQYIDQHEPNLKGYRVARDQAMAFPRNFVYINGWYWAGDEIPTNLINCQCEFVIDLKNGVDLYNRPLNANLAQKRAKVDVIEVDYAIDKTPQNVTQTSKGDALLMTLLRNEGLTQLVRA